MTSNLNKIIRNLSKKIIIEENSELFYWKKINFKCPASNLAHSTYSFIKIFISERTKCAKNESKLVNWRKLTRRVKIIKYQEILKLANLHKRSSNAFPTESAIFSEIFHVICLRYKFKFRPRNLCNT